MLHTPTQAFDIMSPYSAVLSPAIPVDSETSLASNSYFDIQPVTSPPAEPKSSPSSAEATEAQLDALLNFPQNNPLTAPATDHTDTVRNSTRTSGGSDTNSNLTDKSHLITHTLSQPTLGTFNYAANVDVFAQLSNEQRSALMLGSNSPFPHESTKLMDRTASLGGVPNDFNKPEPRLASPSTSPHTGMRSLSSHSPSPLRHETSGDTSGNEASPAASENNPFIATINTGATTTATTTSTAAAEPTLSWTTSSSPDTAVSSGSDLASLLIDGTLTKVEDSSVSEMPSMASASTSASLGALLSADASQPIEETSGTPASGSLLALMNSPLMSIARPRRHTSAEPAIMGDLRKYQASLSLSREAAGGLDLSEGSLDGSMMGGLPVGHPHHHLHQQYAAHHHHHHHQSNFSDNESIYSDSTYAESMVGRSFLHRHSLASTFSQVESDDEGGMMDMRATSLTPSDGDLDTGDSPCQWDDCNLVFPSLASLVDHLSSDHIGSGKSTYVCGWRGCNRHHRPFTKRHKMFNHLRTHTGEKPFPCPVEGCGKSFSRPDSLATHVKTHSDVRPYVCSVRGCGKAYYHGRSLRKHEKSHMTRRHTFSHAMFQQQHPHHQPHPSGHPQARPSIHAPPTHPATHSAHPHHLQQGGHSQMAFSHNMPYMMMDSPQMTHQQLQSMLPPVPVTHNGMASNPSMYDMYGSSVPGHAQQSSQGASVSNNQTHSLLMSEHQQLQQYQIGHRTGNDPAEAAAASSSGYPTGYTGYDHNAAAMAASYQSHGHSNSQGSIDVPLTDYQSSLYASTMDHAIAGKGAANDFHGYMNPSMAMHSTGYQQDPYNTPAGAQSTTGYSLESQFLNSNNGASGTPTGEQSADYTQRLAFELPSPTNTSLMFPSQMLNQQ